MSDTEYTPTLTELRDTFAGAQWDHYGTAATTITADMSEARAAFDRALAAHDEQVRAVAWERCAQIANAMGPVDMALAGSHAGHDVADAIRAVPAEQKESKNNDDR